MSHIQQLLMEANQLEYGPEKVALLQEAVRQADLLNDELRGFAARKDLIQAATFSGQGDAALPAFAWCLAYLDEHGPELGVYEAWSLAWRHKWMLNIALSFPQIPYSRLLELYADFARRARTLGAEGGTVARFDLSLAMHTGDKIAAQQAFAEWQDTGRDRLSNCSACDAQAVADYYAFLGEDAACLTESERVLTRGGRCAHIPHSTYARALEPLMRLGDWERAAEYSARGRRMVSGKADFLSQQADHLQYLALTNPSSALKWYARHLGWAEASGEIGVKGEFHNAAALLFTVLQAAGGRPTRKMQLPPSVLGYREDDTYAIAERLNHHLSAAQTIAAQFDARNGTPFHTEQLAATLALAELRP